MLQFTGRSSTEEQDKRLQIEGLEKLGRTGNIVQEQCETVQLLSLQESGHIQS